MINHLVLSENGLGLEKDISELIAWTLEHYLISHTQHVLNVEVFRLVSLQLEYRRLIRNKAIWWWRSTRTQLRLYNFLQRSARKRFVPKRESSFFSHKISAIVSRLRVTIWYLLSTYDTAFPTPLGSLHDNLLTLRWTLRVLKLISAISWEKSTWTIRLCSWVILMRGYHVTMPHGAPSV